jgi:hypothetical protein
MIKYERIIWSPTRPTLEENMEQKSKRPTWTLRTQMKA